MQAFLSFRNWYLVTIYSMHAAFLFTSFISSRYNFFRSKYQRIIHRYNLYKTSYRVSQKYYAVNLNPKCILNWFLFDHNIPVQSYRIRIWKFIMNHWTGFKYMLKMIHFSLGNKFPIIEYRLFRCICIFKSLLESGNWV